MRGRRGKPKRTTPLQPTPELGAAILKRYKHPDDWREGSGTGKPHLVHTMVLKVEDIRLGGQAYVDEAAARLSAA